MAIEYYTVGDLVRLSEELFYNYEAAQPFRKASLNSAYYTIGMKPWMIGLGTHVRSDEKYLIEPEVYMMHQFIYDVYWSGGIGYRREQHCDLYVISKV